MKMRGQNYESHATHLQVYRCGHLQGGWRVGEYYRLRANWWGEEKDKAVVRAKEAGIEVREYDVTGGKSVEVVIDATVTKRLSECATKIASHQAAADRFQIESSAYGSQPAGREYDLDPSDVVYFRLAGGARGD